LSTTRGRPASPTQGAEEAVASIRSLKKMLALSDQELASRIGVNQSSINRALGHIPPKWTPTLVKICDYAKNTLEMRTGGDLKAKGKAKLAEAAAEMWDGTPNSLERLLSLMHLLAQLRK